MSYRHPFDDDPPQVIRVLRVLRQRKGWSQETTGDLVGIRQGAVSAAENGMASPATLTDLFSLYGESAVAEVLAEKLCLPRDRRPEPRDLMRVVERMQPVKAQG